MAVRAPERDMFDDFDDQPEQRRTCGTSLDPMLKASSSLMSRRQALASMASALACETTSKFAIAGPPAVDRLGANCDGPIFQQPDPMPNFTGQGMVILSQTCHWRDGRAIRGSRSIALARSVISMPCIRLAKSSAR